MARHFTVTQTSGTNSGPYTIYHSSISEANIAVLYGTSNPATNLTLTQLQNGVLVTVPDSATSLIVSNGNSAVIANCPTNIVTYPISSSPDPTNTPNPTSAPTSTPVPTDGSTPQPTSNPTATPVPTDGSTPIPTSTPQPTPNATPNPTSTPNATPNPTSTPIPTASPTPTPSLTGTASECKMYQISNYSMIEELAYRYTDCTTGQLVPDIMQPDYDYYVCSLTRPVRTGGSNSFAIDMGTFDPLCEPAASATPAPSSTPNPTPETLLNFYITGPQFTLDNFCTTNYTATTLVRIASTNGLISGTLNKTAYQSNGTTPYQGSAGRYYFISDTSGAGSTTAQDPRYYVEIGPDGFVNNVGQLDCNGEGPGSGNQL